MFDKEKYTKKELKEKISVYGFGKDTPKVIWLDTAFDKKSNFFIGNKWSFDCGLCTKKEAVDSVYEILTEWRDIIIEYFTKNPNRVYVYSISGENYGIDVRIKYHPNGKKYPLSYSGV